MSTAVLPMLPGTAADRHCPVCQGIQQRRWIETREQRLVPTHHFHVVFTEPEALRPLNLANRRALYGLLFQAARDTLLELAMDRWDAVPGGAHPRSERWGNPWRVPPEPG